MKATNKPTSKELVISYLFLYAFSQPRDLRSDEYKNGVMEAIYTEIEILLPSIPHEVGTAAFDAYCSGLEEGWDIAREYKKGKIKIPGETYEEIMPVLSEMQYAMERQEESRKGWVA